MSEALTSIHELHKGLRELKCINCIEQSPISHPDCHSSIVETLNP